MRWPWRRRRKGAAMKPDEQGVSTSMRCRWCNASKIRRIIHVPGEANREVIYCPTCDQITRRNSGPSTG